MAKRLDIGDKSFRVRRGKWVEIPDEWVGQVPNPQTIRKRHSKQPPKQKDAHVRRLNSDKSMEYIKFKRGDDGTSRNY